MSACVFLCVCICVVCSRTASCYLVGTERLLEQKIPAMYLRLQSVIEALAKERIKEGKDPVLHAEQYK